MKLLSLSGALLAIDSITTVNATTPIYDISVTGVHNYYAGEAGVLVHNTTACDLNIQRIFGSGNNLLSLFARTRLSTIIRNTDNLNLSQYVDFINDLDGSAALRDFIKQVDDAALALSDAQKAAALLEKVRAWKGLLNTGVRTDIPWLTRASKWIDEGGDFVESGGKTWFRKNGDDIFEIKNDKILPNKKSNYHRGADGTPIGDPANGYQVVKVGDDIKVKRVPDEAPYQSGNYLSKLKEHPNAHTLERHGHDVTDDALIKRANEGIAPDGTSLGNSGPPYPSPAYSSKFDTPDQLKSAFDQTKPGTSLFDNTPTTTNGTRKKVILDSGGTTKYGSGVKKNTEDFYDMYKVEAKYELINGEWQLASMHPII